MKNLFIIIISLVIGIFAGIYSRKYFFPNAVNSQDCIIETHTVFDTVRINYPVQISSKPTERIVYVTIPDDHILEHSDSTRKADCASADSITLRLPVTQNVYSDSTYTAYVSGVSPSLDSIFVYPRREIVIRNIKKPPNRWHIGITAGYGFTPKNGTHPFVGIGVTYSLFPL